MSGPDELVEAVAQAIKAADAAFWDQEDAVPPALTDEGAMALTRAAFSVPALAEVIARDAAVAEWVEVPGVPAPSWMSEMWRSGWVAGYALAQSTIAALYPEAGR